MTSSSVFRRPRPLGRLVPARTYTMNTAASGAGSAAEPMNDLIVRLEQEPHLLARGDAVLHTLAQQAVKALHDEGVRSEQESLPYLTSLLDSVAPRQATGKRKHNEMDESETTPHPLFPPAVLDCLVLDGMNDEQVWQQLELRASKVGHVLDHVMSSAGDDGSDEDEDDEEDDEGEHDEDDGEEWADVEGSDDEGFAGASDFSDLDPDEVFYEPLQTEDEQHKRREEKEREEMMSAYNIDDLELLNASLVRPENVHDDEDDEEEEVGDRRPKKSLLDSLDDENAPAAPKRRHPTLDDDFFSIDEFNRQTEADERLGRTSRANLSGEDEDDEDDIDLFTSVSGMDEDEDEGVLGADANYEDFFAPVPGKRSSSAAQKRDTVPDEPAPRRSSLVRFHDQVCVRPIKKCKPRRSAGLLTEGEDEDMSAMEEEEGEDDEDGDDEGEEDEDGDEEGEDEESAVEEEPADEEPADEEAEADAAVARVAQDLFEDEDKEAPQNESTFERRQAELQQEIARYEDENVREKDWTLMGEASSRERPADSLLEEDLEFERTAKTTPSLTQEDSEALEDMIKRRIRERQFDDVIRQRDLDALPFAPSKMLELSDAKSSKSLAELYEDEYQAARGDAPQAESDVKLANEHAAIASDMEALLNKLDALSNAHYTPKAPKAAIETVSNTPSISLESALPTTMSTSSMLAPEEVYEAPRHAEALTGARSEMSHAEKQRLHHQLRHEKRKRNERIQHLEQAVERSRGPRSSGDVKAEKEKALKGLVGNKGVTVVGKDSKRRDKRGKGAAEPATGSRYKL